MEPEILSITAHIDAPPARVYEVAHDPWNLPCWAPSFFLEVERQDDQWVVRSPLGRAVIEFAPLNEEGVLDHTLRLDSGETFVNHMRVSPSGDGSEISFALARREGMSDAQFAADAELVAADFARLKAIVERGVADAARAAAADGADADGGTGEGPGAGPAGGPEPAEA